MSRRGRIASDQLTAASLTSHAKADDPDAATAKPVTTGPAKTRKSERSPRSGALVARRSRNATRQQRLTENASVPGLDVIGPDHPERQQPRELARPRGLARAALVVLLFLLVAAEQSLNSFHHGVDGACCFVFGCAFGDVAKHFR
jgi:hypothetical protein